MKNYVENAPGVLPAINSRSSSICSPKRECLVRRREAILRFATVILAIVSAVISGVASDKEVVLGIEKTVNFRILQTLVSLVITEGILAGYSLLQGIRCIWGLYMESYLLSKKMAWMLFSCDQVMAYVSIAVVASATEAGVLAFQGNTELQWIRLCGFFKKFCLQLGFGLVFGFVAGIVMVMVSAISAYNLFKLYGTTKSKIPQPMISHT